MSIDEKEKLLIQEKIGLLDEQRRRLDEELKLKYMKIDQDHN